jgi:hypothetical protein
VASFPHRWSRFLSILDLINRTVLAKARKSWNISCNFVQSLLLHFPCILRSVTAIIGILFLWWTYYLATDSLVNLLDINPKIFHCCHVCIWIWGTHNSDCEVYDLRCNAMEFSSSSLTFGDIYHLQLQGSRVNQVKRGQQAEHYSAEDLSPHKIWHA